MKRYTLPEDVCQSTKNSCRPQTIIMRKIANDLTMHEKHMQIFQFLNKLSQSKKQKKYALPSSKHNIYTRPTSILKFHLSPLQIKERPHNFEKSSHTLNYSNIISPNYHKKMSLQCENIDQSWTENQSQNIAFHRKKGISEYSDLQHLFAPNYSPKYKKLIESNPHQHKIIKGTFTYEADSPKIIRYNK